MIVWTVHSFLSCNTSTTDKYPEYIVIDFFFFFSVFKTSIFQELSVRQKEFKCPSLRSGLFFGLNGYEQVHVKTM